MELLNHFKFIPVFLYLLYIIEKINEVRTKPYPNITI
nr:MAG TPA: hypothetical protein [Caudoviricetes sp.]